METVNFDQSVAKSLPLGTKKLKKEKIDDQNWRKKWKNGRKCYWLELDQFGF